MPPITSRCALAGAIALSLTVSACSTDENSSAIEVTSSATPSTDTDQARLTQLAEDLWSAREEAGRTSDPARARFEGILAPQLMEREIAELEQYQSLGVTREGAPQISDIEVEAGDDTGTVTMCLDEDGWQAFEEGRLIDGENLGPVPYAFTAERVDDSWQVASVVASKDIEREAPC